jgi:type IV pilus biogenesis protein PilP
MKRYVWTVLAIATVTGVSAVLAAQPGSTPLTAASAAICASAPEQTHSDSLADLDRDAVLWKKRAEIAKYKAEVKTAEARGEPLLATPLPAFPQGTFPQGLSAPLPSPGASASRPSLVRIGGADAHFDALIDVGEHTVDILVGDQIAGGWKVTDIDASQVRLARGKQVLVLK